MNITEMREQHDEILARLYEQEVLLKDGLSENNEDLNKAVTTEDKSKKIKALQEKLNKIRIKM